MKVIAEVVGELHVDFETTRIKLNSNYGLFQFIFNLVDKRFFGLQMLAQQFRPTHHVT